MEPKRYVYFAPTFCDQTHTLISFSESAASENPNQYHEPEKYGCLRQYSLFTLKDYQILLRSNIDGVIRSPGGGGGGGHTSISAKVEYQPTFGAEMQTDDEIAYEWLTAYLKQSDVHCRGKSGLFYIFVY